MMTSGAVRRWYVLVIAGQSNAQGFAEALPDIDELHVPERIRQLGRYRGRRPDGVMEDRWNQIIDASHVLDDVKDMRFSNLSGNQDLRRSGTVGPGVFIARRLLAHLPDDAGILLLPQAHGGAGMVFGQRGDYVDPACCKPDQQPGAAIGRSVCHYPGMADMNSDGAMNWSGADSPLYLDLLQRLRFCLQMSPENRLLGFVWVQGESDAHAGSFYAARHAQEYVQMVDRLGADLEGQRAQFMAPCWEQLPWINVVATRWWDERILSHAQVLQGYRSLALARPRQMHFLDLRIASDGRPMETNAEHYIHPADSDYPPMPTPDLTDGRTCEEAMRHIHLSTAAYRGEVSERIAGLLIRHVLSECQKNEK